MKHNPDIIITLDADGQHDPKDISGVLEPIQNGHAHIVIGSRYGGNSLTEITVIRELDYHLSNLLTDL